MLRSIILFSFILVSSLQILGQTDEISIIVADRKSEIPLIGVNVQVGEMVLVTDKDGYLF